MTTRQLPVLGGHPEGFAGTVREDSWWVGPLLTVAVITTCMGYLTWAAFQGDHYYAGSYLSPLYSPLLFVEPSVPGAAPLEHAWLGEWPSWWPALIPASPALLILPFPGLFRFTCYYYRKAYYRAFAGSPPGCAVVPLGMGRKYRGETALMLFQNLHRYALYVALLYIVVLYYDAFMSLSRDGELGIGVGSVVLFVNVTLIAAYTFGCHSFRHLVGGHDDCMSCGQQSLKYATWQRVTWFNGRHMQFAWVSLITVTLTDVYIRLVSMGILEDLNTWS